MFVCVICLFNLTSVHPKVILHIVCVCVCECVYVCVCVYRGVYYGMWEEAEYVAVGAM